MNSRQLEVMKASAKDEEKVIRELKQVYTQARKDCEKKILELSSRTDMQNIQSIVYQVKYQEALKSQLDDVLNELNQKQFTTISDYLEQCYETGFFGTLYDLQGQGIPLIFPINQDELTRAIQTDSQISGSLYSRLGEDTTKLKTSIRAELSRGLANGSSWEVIAMKIATGMNSPFDVAYNKAIRIARTEGGRIVQESQFQVQQKAKDAGADIVKQWDATFDGKTRPHHLELDGQVKELDEPYEVAGMKAMYPHAFGVASEDINCRCHSLQRARWALDAEQTKYLGDVSEMSEERKKEIADKLGVAPNELGNVSKSIVQLKSNNLKDFTKEAKDVLSKVDSSTAQLGGLVDYPKTHHKEILQFLDDAPEPIRKAWNTVCGDFHVLKRRPRLDKRSGAWYSPSRDGVVLSISSVAKGSSYATPYQTLFHEFGHHMDYIFNRRFGTGDVKKAFTETYKGGIFGQTLKREAEKHIEDFAKASGLTKTVTRQEAYVEWQKLQRFNMTNGMTLEEYLAREEGKVVIDRIEAERMFCESIKNQLSLMARSDISDMFEPVMKTLDYPFGVGHGKSYWGSRDNGKEGFAEMFSAMTNNPESWEAIKTYFPESVKIFEEMLKVVE